MTDDDDEPLADLVAEVDEEEEESADQDRMEELADDAADAEQEFRGATDDVPAAGGPVDGVEGDAGPEADDPAPLSDVSREVRRRREHDRSDDDALFDEAFDEASASDADDDALWENLAEDDVGGTVEDPATDSERDVRVVEKREFCERCQFFSAPPDVACENEGSEILEMEGTDRFRVADCPIVRGEENLGDTG